MIYTTTNPLNYDHSLKSNISVSEVSGGNETSLNGMPRISNSSYKDALERSSAGVALLSDHGEYKLEVHIVEVDQPSWAVDVTVEMQVKYTLTNVEENKIILNETLLSSNTATKSDS